MGIKVSGKFEALHKSTSLQVLYTRKMAFLRNTGCPLTIGLILAIFATISTLCTPTINKADHFDPKKDASDLHLALRQKTSTKLDTDIMDIIARRVLKQRLMIAEMYTSFDNKSLSSDLEARTREDFRRIIVALMKPVPKLYADVIWDMRGVYETSYKYVELLAPLVEDNYFKEISTALYQGHGMTLNQFRNSLADTSTGKKSTEPWSDLLEGIVEGRRSTDDKVDVKKAIEDARMLVDIKKYVKPRRTFTSILEPILKNSNYPQLREILIEYKRLKGKPLNDTMKSILKREEFYAYNLIVQSAANTSTYFAERLNWALKKPVRKWLLTTILVGRSEIDLHEIKNEYNRLYRFSLEGHISAVVSGSYKKILLIILGAL